MRVTYLCHVIIFDLTTPKNAGWQESDRDVYGTKSDDSEYVQYTKFGDPEDVQYTKFGDLQNVEYTKFDDLTLVVLELWKEHIHTQTNK